MDASKFEQLSSLVLVDILGALPMEHVLRISRLGHERLRHTASLKWVTNRMTHVDFGTIVKASELGGDVANTFCTDSILKSLKGKIPIAKVNFTTRIFTSFYFNLVEQVPGFVHFCFTNDFFALSKEDIRKSISSVAYCNLKNLSYISLTKKVLEFKTHMICSSQTMRFEYQYMTEDKRHFVRYRPALMNGRHIVDVLRAVCGPADVSEAELNRVRRSATDGARDEGFRGEKWQGVWMSTWRGDAVTAEA